MQDDTDTRIGTSTPSQSNPPDIDHILVDRKVAAKLLSLSERSVWDLTDRGELPFVKYGRAVRYPVQGLRDWVKKRTERLGQ